uniref:Cytochrome c oxidase subunit 2 n=1 Tax=Hypochilus thorelli TaxID=139869 RepID=B2CKT3_HYPTH|nr:cytochrome c oxidase subunit II [Hypochilus thorelli]ACA62645.1 cytochrome oxidase subunit 2 [Hypochilus thorelli]
MPVWGSLYFHNSVSPVMEQLIFFHDHVMVIMLLVMVLVGYLLVNSMAIKFYSLALMNNQEVESIWTLLPAVFLLLIAFPSLRLLYLMEEMDSPEITLKVLGHQWYWEYEYSDFNNMEFESYMESNSLFRLLNVDNSVIFPVNSNIRVIVSSEEVIHSWTVPSLGVKADAIPGRLNQLLLFFNRVGCYVGQCSEICGANHSFMPIFIGVVTRDAFLNM